MNTLNKACASKLWSADFIIVFSVNFFSMLVYFILLITIVPYVAKTFNVDSSIAGLASGIMVLGILAGRFASSYLGELFGFKKILFIGSVSFIISLLLYFLATNLTLLLSIRFISGIALGIISTVTATVAVYAVPALRRAEGISYFSMSSILAAAIGPFIGILTIQHAEFKYILITCILLAIICFGVTFKLSAKAISIPKTTRHNTKLNISDFIEPKCIPLSCIILIVSTGYASVQMYMSFYSAQLNLVTAASFFFLVYAFAVFISRPFTGKIIDRRGEHIVAYPALAILILGFILLGNTHSGWALLLSGALIGLGFGNIQSTIQAAAVNLASTDRMGQATSTFFIFSDCGVGLGPFVLGKLIPYIGLQGLYLTCAFISFVCIMLYYLLHGRKPIPHKTPQP